MFNDVIGKTTKEQDSDENTLLIVRIKWYLKAIWKKKNNIIETNAIYINPQGNHISIKYNMITPLHST